MSTPGSPARSPLPQAGRDPTDPSDPMNTDKDTPTPPPADPSRDMDADPAAEMDGLSDDDSVLSEVDEAQFEDFDPSNLNIEEHRPAIAVDEDNVKLIGRHKRQRDQAEGETGKKKKKEGRREKPKRAKKKTDDDDAFSGGEELEGKRPRKKKGIAEDVEKRERRRARSASDNDDDLDDETRRRKELDRAIDAAVKNPNRRRRKMDGIDISTMVDDEIASLRTRMAEAAERDVEARSADPPRPAMHKLKLLPEVTAFLNRNGRDVESAIVDPENNLLESVRFFLEPLNDGSLPAYNIQRDLFAALAKLPVGKDALLSSGIGKVVLFYTKSRKPEPGIKRTAERLLAEWTRPILKRSDNYRNRVLEERRFDPKDLEQKGRKSVSDIMRDEARQRRARELAPPTNSNRARIEPSVKTYNVVPMSNVVEPKAAKKTATDRAFRRMQVTAAAKASRRG